MPLVLHPMNFRKSFGGNTRNAGRIHLQLWTKGKVIYVLEFAIRIVFLEAALIAYTLVETQLFKVSLRPEDFPRDPLKYSKRIPSPIGDMRGRK